ncbi:MAG: HalD/BesD family halogenase [Paracoccaceae bacterium]
MQIADFVNMGAHPISEPGFADECRETLDQKGVLVLSDFITPQALADILSESQQKQDQAYFCTQKHSVYLTSDNADFPADHPANRKVESSKGCICDDSVGPSSALRALYDAAEFRSFVKTVTGESELHEYADPLSSINIHYAGRGQELGWHFDNSSFAITLLIQEPDAGGRFEYIKNLRNAGTGEMNFDGVGALLDGRVEPEVLSMKPGALVLFRGRNSIHRVSPNESDRMRILAVLAYNAEPGVALSESARMTFYGRLG